jgi:tRNA threonylcarbamoyladenosine biosynthesis protein TsaB
VKLLALDTATEACSAALWLDGQVLAAEEVLDRGHGERILPMVDELLRHAGLALVDVDAVAVGRGPGGFTGVRLGLGVAQGLAFGAGKALVGISNLAAVALRALARHPAAARVLVCADARMREVYAAHYARTPEGLVVLRGEEHVCAPEAVRVPEGSGSLVGAGTGFGAYAQLEARFRKMCIALEPSTLPGAREIAQLAVVAVERGEALDPAGIAPVYLRNEVAKPAGVTDLQ